jgi:ribosomal protein L12E/L44/L45/RPP1/RPP2
VEGRLKSLREDEAAQRVQIEQMQAQIEMLKTTKRDMEQITAMLASQTVAAASAGETDDADDDGDPQPEESTSESESGGEKKQSEEDAWNEYGDVLETGLAELRALRTQLRS